MPAKKKVETKVRESELFDTLNIIEDITETKEVQKLDLFKEVLPAIQRRDYNFYFNLSPERQKDYQPYIIQRWMSNVQDTFSHYYYCQTVNNLVNRNFWDLSKHPGLQHQLLCMARAGDDQKYQKHQWLKFMGAKRKKSLVNEWILKTNPGLRDDELEIIKASMTLNDFKMYLESAGVSEQETKKLVKEWKDEEKSR